MSNAIGIIFANNGSDNLQGLAAERPLAAVPFGGRYRILDFALSSMVNSGIRTIGLVTPHQYRPLLDHLGAGKDWFLERKHGGLFILPGVMHGLAGSNHLFCIKDLENNCEFLEKEYVKNVVISSGDKIYNLNFKETLEFHEEKQADITLIYKNDPYPDGRIKTMFVLKLDEAQKLASISDPHLSELGLPEGDFGEVPQFANILVIRRELLLDMIRQYSSVGCIDLMSIIVMNLGILKVFAKPTHSLFGTISTINDYFERSMDLLQSSVREQLWLGVDRTHTKIVDNPPTKYAEKAQVRNSLIASGCTIAGEVINSIIFRGVVIEPGCRVQNSIIMPQCHIYANAQTDYAILDKSVRVYRDNSLKGSRSHPLVVLKKTVI